MSAEPIDSEPGLDDAVGQAWALLNRAAVYVTADHPEHADAVARLLDDLDALYTALGGRTGGDPDAF